MPLNSPTDSTRRNDGVPIHPNPSYLCLLTRYVSRSVNAIHQNFLAFLLTFPVESRHALYCKCTEKGSVWACLLGKPTCWSAPLMELYSRCLNQSKYAEYAQSRLCILVPVLHILGLYIKAVQLQFHDLHSCLSTT